jgi:predicted GNAT family acetyltransferase
MRATEDTTDGVTVTEAPDRRRFEVRVGGELAGFSRYEMRDGAYAFLHTEVDPAFEGQGLGSRLVRAALEEMRRRGTAVLPYCPFVRSFIERHHDYLDLVPSDSRERFALPG